MPDIDWDILKKLDLKVAWRFAAKDMSKEFFSSQMVVVPHIEEASFYDLMVCFTKEKVGMLEKMTKAEPEYQLLGHISDLVRVRSEDGSPRTDTGELLYTCQHPSMEEIEITTHSRTWEEGKKSITVEMTGLSKYVTNWAIGEGNLVLDTDMVDLQGIKTIYIISEVIYAQKVRVEVVIGTRILADEILKRIPVAYSYMKFPMDKMGVVQPAKDNKLNISPVFQLVGEEEDETLGLGGGKREPVAKRTRSQSG